MSGAAEILATARIEKLRYSLNPWRIVSSDGIELWAPVVFDHPNLGQTEINRPLCFPRKRDALAELERLRAEMAQPPRDQLAANYGRTT